MTEFRTRRPPPPDIAGKHGTFARIGVVAALAVTAFSYVTAENLPIGLLPLIADDLHTSLSAVGMLVTAYGGTVALVSVPLTYLVRRIPRRSLLTVLLAVLVVSTVVSASASTYSLLLSARICTAMSQAVFWSVAAPTVATLFPPQVRGRIISTVFAGASLASVLGVPAGTRLGQQAGWRVAFVALSVLGLLALLAVATLLPNVRAGQGHAARGSEPDTRRYLVVIGTTMLSIAGVFTAYTYTVVFLIEVSGFSAPQVALLLLVQGVAGVAGVACFAVLADRIPKALLLGSVSLLTVSLFGLYLFGAVRPAAAGMVALFGFALSGVASATQNRIMYVAPGSTEMATAWNSTAFNVGIGGGALVGAVLLPQVGVRATALAGGLLTAAALALLLFEPLIAGGGPAPARPRRPHPPQEA